MENMIPEDGIIWYHYKKKISLKIVLVSMPKSELNCCDLLYSIFVNYLQFDESQRIMT